MTQTYRTTDLLRWGTGKGSNLTSTEVDRNFWDALERIVALETDMPDVAASISSFSVSGAQFYVHMSDASVLGPYALPVSTFRDRGEWGAGVAYSVLDTFTINGGLYRVLFAHTSDVSFDDGANDGDGHDYYALMVQTPGSSLPTGGAVDQILVKSSSSDFAVTWGYKLPAGGTARQYLIKINSTQDNAAWGAPLATDIQYTPSTGSSLSSGDIGDVIEQLENLIDTTTSGLTFDAVDITFTPMTGSVLTSTDVASALEELSEAVAEFDPGTAVEYLANTADKALISDQVWSAAALVTLTDAATITIDMSTFINASVILNGNRTLGNPTNVKIGQSGVIEFIQGSGSNTLTLSSYYKTAGGGAGITLSTASGAVDLLYYQVITSTFIYVTLVQDVQ
jgi:hypothetical protein